MAKYRPPSQSEKVFAVHLLQYMHANSNNAYLVLAIIAWLRAESGYTYIGNNPLNLRPGTDDAQYRSRIRKGKVGYFSVYRSLDAGAHATANRLMRLGYYKDVIAAARYTPVKSAKLTLDQAMQNQGLDFLAALALSKWDAGHYGEGKAPTLATYDPAKNNLIPIWAGLLGHPFTWPTEPVKPPHVATQPPAPPKNFEPTAAARRDYIQPYDAYGFYEARHTEPTPLTGD